MTSNVAQSYPYTTETEAERATAIQRAIDQFSDLDEKINAETDPLPDLGPAEPGRPHRSWVFVCPKHITGRLHVAGYGKETHALYTVCDEGGETYFR